MDTKMYVSFWEFFFFFFFLKKKKRKWAATCSAQQKVQGN
jgi:hypothetical protein